MLVCAGAGGAHRSVARAGMIVMIAIAGVLGGARAFAAEPAPRLPQFRPEAIETVDDAERALAAVDALRRGLPAEWAARRRECAGRMLVSACEA